MRPYRVKYTRRADRDLEMRRETARKVVGAIHRILEDPYQSVKKLRASNPDHPVYSLRVRKYTRALLSIHDNVLIIHVLLDR